MMWPNDRNAAKRSKLRDRLMGWLLAGWLGGFFWLVWSEPAWLSGPETPLYVFLMVVASFASLGLPVAIDWVATQIAHWRYPIK